MQFNRYYTDENWDTPYGDTKFVKRRSEIKNPDGSVVFEMDNVIVPDTWTQVSTDVIAQKYFRKAGVPAEVQRVPEKGVPGWLQRSVPAKKNRTCWMPPPGPRRTLSMRWPS